MTFLANHCFVPKFMVQNYENVDSLQDPEAY